LRDGKAKASATSNNTATLETEIEKIIKQQAKAVQHEHRINTAGQSHLHFLFKRLYVQRNLEEKTRGY